MKTFSNYKARKIFYQITGNGPAIVLLHGFMESSDIWKNYIRKLSDSFTVLTIDLPGHGRSESISEIHSMDLMADAVNQTIRSAGINSCILVGHSMGGYVTLAFAEKHPRKVKAIVLFHSHAGADIPEIKANRDRTISIVQKDRHSYIKTFIPGHFDPENVQKFQSEIKELQQIAEQTPKEGIIAALEGMKNRPDRQHVLTQSKVPVLFIVGKNDSRVPMQVVLPQTVLPEHSEMLLLDHVGHMGFIEAPGKTFAAIKGFAQRIYF
jgi:pimeloyl-ACP methyl ester carboxylesterase